MSGYLEKIVDWDSAAEKAAHVRDAGGKVVFTNGCFDLIHSGHVRYLQDARNLGDMLILGLNSDNSVRSLGKGDDRPIIGQEQRAEVAAALSMVDLVVIFDQPTPYEIIARIRPDVLVKGGDWAPKDIVGNDLVYARGGEVYSLPYVEGFSTTSILKKIRKV